MTIAPLPSSGKCPYCGAESFPTAWQCWLCHRGLAVPPVRGATGAGGTKLAARPPKFSPSPLSYSLAEIFMAITLVAVGLGLGRMEPGLGVAFGLIAVPAFAITALRTRREERIKGRDIGIAERIVTFLVSSVVVIGVWIAVQIAIVFAIVIALLAVCGGIIAFSR